MKISAKSGAVIAATAAALIANITVAPAVHAEGNHTVKCFGLNACKGNGGCKSLGNACKGHNACKGQGFSMMKKSTCVAKGGSTARS